MTFKPWPLRDSPFQGRTAFALAGIRAAPFFFEKLADASMRRRG